MTALAPFPSFFPSHDPKITRREDEKEGLKREPNFSLPLIIHEPKEKTDMRRG